MITSHVSWLYKTMWLFKNWPAIYFDKLRGRDTNKLVLRNGQIIYTGERNIAIAAADEVFREKVYGTLIGLGREVVVLDIGAHLGTFSLYAHDVLKGRLDVKIISFEPVAETFKYLTKNVGEVAELHRAAVVGSGGGKRTIYIQGPCAGKNSLYASQGTPEEIDAVSIHDVLKPLKQVGFMKLDCEGAEEEILDAMTDEEWAKIRSFAVECSTEYASKLASKNVGFKQISFIHSVALFQRV